MDIEAMPVVTVKLDALVPYWRNPRLITDEAVNAVAESIRRFGYQQPIVVDEDMVIVVGHTRYSALRRLGYEEAQVKLAKGLTQQQVKQLRIVDNRTAELGIWDFEKLVEEMGDLDADLMTKFFPELSEGVFGDETAGGAVQLGYEIIGGDPPAEEDHGVEFVCPSCFHIWEGKVTLEQVLAGTILPEEVEV